MARVLLLGATGTIGQATLAALLRSGHAVVCFGRRRDGATRSTCAGNAANAGVEVRFGDVNDPQSVAADAFRGERFDALISCMASRTGAPKDAWAVDHAAHVNILAAARIADVGHFVLLSAICVQKPLLAFQYAKLAFEKCLIESGMKFSIVRPTVFFKSLSGQFARVKSGKPYLLFGTGALTACKPISDNDLANFLTACLVDENSWNRVLPIGGPGAAITPRQQGERLFALLRRTPRFKSVPIRLLDTIIAVLGAIERFVPAIADKTELARIGRYYATESMLVWSAEANCYDDAATPSTGDETLFDFYADLVAGKALPERGDHSVF